jgi:replication factor A1
LGLDVIQKEAEKVGNPEPLDAPTKAPSADGTPAPMAVDPPAPQQPTSHKQPEVKPYVKPQPAQPARPSRPTYPIDSLSPYQNNWTIKARVTQKSDIRKWSNQRGEGQLFSVTLMDESGEIRGTGFNHVVDELYNKFEEGKVYYISKARVNLAKKKFGNVANDYELSFEKNTEVEEVLNSHACLAYTQSDIRFLSISAAIRLAFPRSSTISLSSVSLVRSKKMLFAVRGHYIAAWTLNSSMI